MKEELISFETAKLAKEKCFNIPILIHYTEYLVDNVDIETELTVLFCNDYLGGVINNLKIKTTKRT